MLSPLLPTEFVDTICLSEEHLQHYLQSVGGGHPVHTSRARAIEAGFQAPPVPGVHVQGTILARFTQELALHPIQLLEIKSRFRAPVYPGHPLSIWLSILPDSLKQGPHYQIGVMAGQAVLADGTIAVELSLTVRISTVLAPTSA